MNSIARSALAGISALSMLAAVAVAGAQKPAAKAGAYAKVDKVIKAKCVGCHNGPAGAGGVNLASYAVVTKGKYKGKPLVVPKNVKASVLVNALHGKGVQKMPPGGSLPPADIKTIEAWIAAGAKA